MQGMKLIIAAAALATAMTGLAMTSAAQEGDDTGGAGMDVMDSPGMGLGHGMMGPGTMRGRGMMMGRGVMACSMMHGLEPRACIRLMEMADEDGNGRVSLEEASQFWSRQIERYDANDDGNLSIEEFADMHAAHIRPIMVDRFQFFDEDGDAKVTESELKTPFKRMLLVLDRDGDRAFGGPDVHGRMDGMRERMGEMREQRRMGQGPDRMQDGRGSDRAGQAQEDDR